MSGSKASWHHACADRQAGQLHIKACKPITCPASTFPHTRRFRSAHTALVLTLHALHTPSCRAGSGVPTSKAPGCTRQRVLSSWQARKWRWHRGKAMCTHE